MTRLSYAGLFIAGLLVNLIVASLQHSAGYVDADYYYAGGIRLVGGHGFSEVAPWNYINDPQGLPTPSHGYWYPLASLVAAAGMLVTGSTAYTSARIGFILLAALIPPLTAALAYRLTRRPDLALTAGALALLPTYFTPFIPVTDNYGVYMVLGAAFFLLLDRSTSVAGRWTSILVAGLAVGAMNLARTDGMLWVLAGLLFIALRGVSTVRAPAEIPFGQAGPEADVTPRFGWRSFLARSGVFLAGYLLLMLPWFIRNYATWGTLLAPGGSRALMLHQYADTFAFPASRLDVRYLLSAPWSEVLSVRLGAAASNLDSTGNLQISLFLLPFTLVGLWSLRRETVVQVGLAVWLALFCVMSILFPFAGPRGSFTHSTAALYSLWWSAGVAGVGVVLAWCGRRGWHAVVARRNLILLGLVVVNTMLSAFLAHSRVISMDWDRFDRIYRAIEARLAEETLSPRTPVLVVNPPAYFTANRRPAIPVPVEDIAAVLALASKFGAGFLILESDYLRTPDLQHLYDSPQSNPAFVYVDRVEDARIFRINR